MLLILSFPKFGEGFFAWGALLPLLYALKDARRLTEAFSYGFITGLICHIGVIYWIAYVVVHYGNLPYLAGTFAMLLLAAYMSLYVAVFASGIVYFRQKNIPAIITAPALWTVLEYAKSHIFTGFPWENLAYSQYTYLPIVQIADITGIYGITFALIMINVIIYDVLLIGEHKKKWVIGEAITGCVIIIVICTYGVLKIQNVRYSLNNADPVDVSIIQGNIDQDIKWNPQFQKETINAYKNLSLSKAISGSKLIVWPETATPFYFQEMTDMQGVVIDVAKKSGSWLLFGSPSYLKDKKGISLMNSAFLLSPDGNVRGRYDKVHLVPYGEYVPLRQLFPFISKLAAGVGDFSSGKGFYPLSMDRHKIGVLICYEGIFPEISRSYKKMDAELLINITNDAWFGRSSAPYQHLSMTTFRAVENRVYIVRAANTGISAVIDPTGKITKRTKLFEETSLRETVKYMNDRTLYMLYGDAFVYFCMLLLCGCILITTIRRKENA